MQTQVARIDLRRLPILAKEKIDHAQLPAKYMAARKALQECWRIDEIKDIQDRHSAIAHYAKQAKDKTLMEYAQRIQLRAFERIGELLKEFEDTSERHAVAEKNGIDRKNAWLAYEAAHAPKEVRDELIERSPPALRTELAGAGSGYSAQKRYTPTGRRKAFLIDAFEETAFDKATDVLGGMLDVITENGAVIRARDLASPLSGDEVAQVREPLLKLIEWLDEFEQHLPKTS